MLHKYTANIKLSKITDQVVICVGDINLGALAMRDRPSSVSIFITKPTHEVSLQPRPGRGKCRGAGTKCCGSVAYTVRSEAIRVDASLLRQPKLSLDPL